MAEPFLAEIMIVGFTFAPRGYALCDGQILPINQNQSLYSLLGTTYGGDGRTTFALPDLRGRVNIGPGRSNGSDYRQGQKGGQDNVILTTAQIPSHSHRVVGNSAAGTTNQPAGNFVATGTSTAYVTPVAANLKNMNTGAVQNAGGNQQHSNLQPYLGVNYCIAMQGTFPSRN